MTNQTTPRVIDGRYALGDPINSGAMSTVYKGYDLQGSREVAIKLISRDSEPDDRIRETAFEREMDALRRLQHENIVELLGWGSEGSDWYVVLPLLQKDLQTYLDELHAKGEVLYWDDEPGQAGVSRALALPLARGLAYAHERSVLHRDIKPSNVLLDRAGPRLADFGIAKIKDDVRSAAMTFVNAGTHPYRPREEDDGTKTHARDVHALGVLLIAALSSLDPYDAQFKDSPYQFIDAALDDIDPPAEVDELLRMCVSEDPHDRPENGSVLLSRLEQIDKVRSRSWVQRRTFHINLTNNAQTKAATHFNVAERDAESTIRADIAENARFTRFVSPSTGETIPGEYRLYGAEASYHVKLDDHEGRSCFVIVGVTKPQGSSLDQWREHAFDPNATFEFGSPPNRQEALRQIGLLEQAILDHESRQAEDASKYGASQVFRDWRNVLRALEEIERRREHPLKYKKVDTERGSSIVFELDDDVEESEVLDQPRKIALDGGGFFTGVVAGVNGKRLSLAASPGRDPRRIPPSGELRVDTWPAVSAIRRQSAALDRVEYDHCVRPGLGSLLASPETAQPAESSDEISFINAALDPSKQEAVKAALGSQDFLVVEGPPGTGKTTFITELVQQELQRNPDARILIASQTHAALDNVVERLAKATPDARLVRIARDSDPRVSSIATNYLLEQQLAAWRKEVVANSQAFLKTWANDAGLELRTVEHAAWFEEIAAFRERDAETLAQIEEFEIALAEKPTNLVPGTSLYDRFDRLESELDRLKRESAGGENERREIAVRLQKRKVLDRLTDAETLTPDELRGLGTSGLDPNHPELEHCTRLVKLLAEWHTAFGRGDDFLVATLERSHVIAATCLGLQQVTGADKIEFDLCIVDEASKATATEVLVPVAQSKRWVLVGDRRQLPPFFDNDLSDSTIRDRFQLNDSSRTTLFSRLADHLPRASVRLLSEQHRMHPAIGNLISHCFYNNELTSHPRDPMPHLSLALEAPVNWISTSRRSDQHERRLGKSYQNMAEARIAKMICERFALLASSTRREEVLEIALLSGYSAQRDLLERQVQEVASRYADFISIVCSSVDAFQGRECDIAIYSITRSNPQGKLGFLAEESRLNVALSRPRHALAIVGDHSFIRRAQGTSRALLDVLEYVETHQPDCAITMEDAG